MTVDERIEALTGHIESLHSSIKELRGVTEGIKELRAVAESHNVHLESLHSSTAELHSMAQRHEELIKLLARDTTADAENIRALARIAEIHERRLSNLEGPENPAAA
jgi:ABC-type transporter Mla subunit MlaD